SPPVSWYLSKRPDRPLLQRPVGSRIKASDRTTGGSGMAAKIRLGLIGASLSGTWSARFASAGAASQCGGGVDGGLHHPSRQRRGSAPDLGCPTGLRRLSPDGRLAGDRRDRGRRARAVSLCTNQGGAGGGQARLLRMAARADDGGGRG